MKFLVRPLTLEPRGVELPHYIVAARRRRKPLASNGGGFLKSSLQMSLKKSKVFLKSSDGLDGHH